MAAPFGYLIGIGCFDYWFYWASGKPTRPEDHSGHGARSWKDYFRVNTDHKVIGIQYIVTTFFFFIAGGLMAMVMRAELAQPGTQFVDPNTFNGLFSVHASLMIFLFIIPVFAGHRELRDPADDRRAGHGLPAPERALVLDAAGGRRDDAGELLRRGRRLRHRLDGLRPALHRDADWASSSSPSACSSPGASSIATALNFLVTIITMRAPGMTFWRMPLLVWANFTTSLLVVIATPFIAGSQFFVLLDRSLGTHFFEPGAGGDVLMYQHVFWFYSHPAVYIMMLPGFGIISEVISTNARKPVFGYRMMAFSLVAIVILGFTVWAHHMFVSGMFSWLRVPMMITTMLIAVPTGIKIFSWLATLWRGVIHLRTPMLFALGFITMFTLGGISGIMLAVVPFDDPRVGHVLHRRPHPLRAVRRLRVHDLRRHLPLVPEDDRPDVRRDARQAALLAVVHLLQPDLRADAPRGHRRHAAAGGRLRRAVRHLERDHLDLGVHLRRLVPDLPLQHDRLVAARAGRPPPTRGERNSIEWQVSSPPPIFNFDEIPTVVGGPYEYGTPGAVHAVFKEKAPAQVPAPAGGGGAPPPTE